MLTRIQSRNLPIPAQNNEISKPASPAPRTVNPPKGFGESRANTRSLNNLGIALMKEQHGEAFAKYYHCAWNAAEQLSGGDFLQQYRALKRNAQQQGMSDSEFQRFERCLYRRFYDVAVRDAVEKSGKGRPPKVRPHELAYIAKVAGVSEFDLKRDALAQERSEYIGKMKTLVAQGGFASTRSYQPA